MSVSAGERCSQSAASLQMEARRHGSELSEKSIVQVLFNLKYNCTVIYCVNICTQCHYNTIYNIQDIVIFTLCEMTMQQYYSDIIHMMFLEIFPYT